MILKTKKQTVYHLHTMIMLLFVDEIVKSLYDIAKYKTTAYVNTGDRTLDSLLVALAVIFLNLMISKEQKIAFKSYFFGSFIQPKFMKLFPFEPVEFQRSYPYATENAIFWIKLLNYMNSGYISWAKTSKNIEEGAYDTQTNIPIYVTNGNIVWASNTKTFGTRNFTLYSSDDKALDECEKAFRAIPLPKDITEICEARASPANQVNLRIMKYPKERDEVEHFLPKDRVFDQWTSRHKKEFMRYLERFLKVCDTGISAYNGHGNYNFGILLEGRPGCGKTSFIKALANRTNRNIVIVNMREINTRKGFEKIFSYQPIDRTVFVFEEFDCLPIFTREVDVKQNNVKEMLRTQRSELMHMISTAPDADSRKNYQRQLDRLTSDEEEINNVLTIDTILTVLDGVYEHRGRIIVATTNHIEKIDPALLREGRFDYKLHMHSFNTQEVRELLQNMYKNIAPQEELDLLNATEFPEKWAPVQIINIALRKETLRETIEFLRNEESEL